MSDPKAEAPMSLIVALHFAEHPRPHSTMEAPADSMEELREALRVMAEAYRAAQPAAGMSGRREQIASFGEDGLNPTYDEGIDFALTQLCSVLGVDPQSVAWDAATETIDGDVQAVIGNILRTKFGEDWSTPPVAGTERAAASLSDFTDAQIATEHGWRMQRALGDPRICVGGALVAKGD